MGDSEMEFGVGIHGEPGRRRDTLKSADAICEEIVAAITRDLPVGRRDVLLFINGFGGTPLMELYLMYNSTARLLRSAGATIIRSLVGNYVTSLDMAGASITVTVLDGEIAPLWDAPVHTAALRW